MVTRYTSFVLVLVSLDAHYAFVPSTVSTPTINCISSDTSSRHFASYLDSLIDNGDFENNDGDPSSSRPSTFGATSLAKGQGITSYVDSMGSPAEFQFPSEPAEPEIIIDLDPEMQALFLSQDDITSPNPSFDALQVATLCMNALRDQSPQDSLEVCFNFSSDRCRAAVGGTLEEFMAYAANPTFGKLVHCGGYKIKSVGPIIAGSVTRGAMQTIMVEIQKALTVNDAISSYTKEHKGRRPIEERIREQEARDRGELMASSGETQQLPSSLEAETSCTSSSGTHFLWTLQKERRPPRQNCWLVHEVLFVKNAFELTE